ncbi:hypothetical protein B0H10DRAFT_1944809 [Mycena sp. CBHHK59/15]|nr:hypothetical protein B0H10DRAFT_1944809 [Mycena sp. CBHHK59/15]
MSVGEYCTTEMHALPKFMVCERCEAHPACWPYDSVDAKGVEALMDGEQFHVRTQHPDTGEVVIIKIFKVPCFLEAVRDCRSRYLNLFLLLLWNLGFGRPIILVMLNRHDEVSDRFSYPKVVGISTSGKKIVEDPV